MSDDNGPGLYDDEVEPDEYDHDFEAEEVCVQCGETADNCEGHEDFDEEFEDSEVCAVCGNDRGDPVHGE